jgi:hypothetical protein
VVVTTSFQNPEPAPDLTPVPPSPERLAEIREHVSSISNFTLGNLAARDLLAEVDRLTALVEFEKEDAASLRAKVGDRNATIDRLATRVGELEAALPSRFASTPLQVEQHLSAVLAEDVHLRYQQAIGSYAVGEAAKSLRMDANLRQLEGNHEEAAETRELANLIDPLRGGGPYPSALVRFGCGAEVTS